jgi:hypothetical protein
MSSPVSAGSTHEPDKWFSDFWQTDQRVQKAIKKDDAPKRIILEFPSGNS